MSKFLLPAALLSAVLLLFLTPWFKSANDAAATTPVAKAATPAPCTAGSADCPSAATKTPASAQGTADCTSDFPQDCDPRSRFRRNRIEVEARDLRAEGHG